MICEFRASAAEDEIDLLVYGYIANAAGWEDECGAKQLRERLDAFTGQTINVRINSGGGDAFAGIAIYNMLAAHPAEKRITIEGLAASAASVVAMSGASTMARGAMLMIHNPSAVALGDADDMRKTAEVLDKLTGSLADIYQAKAKDQDRQKILDLMAAETWLTADEAQALGFVDQVVGEAKVEAKSGALFFNSISFPAGICPRFAAQEEEEMDLTAFRSALGLPEGATVDEAITAVRALSAECAVQRAAAEQAVTRALAAEARLAESEAQQRTREIEAVVAQAIERDRKLPPAAAAELRTLGQTAGIERLRSLLAVLPPGGGVPAGIQGGAATLQAPPSAVGLALPSAEECAKWGLTQAQVEEAERARLARRNGAGR